MLLLTSLKWKDCHTKWCTSEQPSYLWIVSGFSFDILAIVVFSSYLFQGLKEIYQNENVTHTIFPRKCIAIRNFNELRFTPPKRSMQKFPSRVIHDVNHSPHKHLNNWITVRMHVTNINHFTSLILSIDAQLFRIYSTFLVTWWTPLMS